MVGAGLLICEWDRCFRGNFCEEGVFQTQVCNVYFSTRWILFVLVLFGREPMRDQEVQFLVRTTAGEKEADAAGVFQDHGADLEEFQADGADIGLSQFGALQGDAPDRLDQRVGQ